MRGVIWRYKRSEGNRKGKIGQILFVRFEQNQGRPGPWCTLPLVRHPFSMALRMQGHRAPTQVHHSPMVGVKVGLAHCPSVSGLLGRQGGLGRLQRLSTLSADHAVDDTCLYLYVQISTKGPAQKPTPVWCVWPAHTGVARRNGPFCEETSRL